MANETDFAYAAGLVDGEGCIGIYRNKAKSCRSGYRIQGLNDKKGVKSIG